MRYSESALRVLAAKECGIIKTNAQFWKDFSDKNKFDNEVLNNNEVKQMAEKISEQLNLLDSQKGMVCAYDEEFPIINSKVKNNGDKPYLLFYQGELSLLNDLNKNVAVIGLIDSDEQIMKREADIVNRLVKNNLVVVSGLAIGCDTIAHKSCLEANGKTIAVLPSQLDKIYPSQNRVLAESIVKEGGLIISEYYKQPLSRRESINRFIERDRLQAMFSKAIILIASYRKGEGDSGSRHAMEAARKYEIERYVMYNSEMDEKNIQFGLNKDLINSNGSEQAKILMPSSINHIKDLVNPNISKDIKSGDCEQLKFI